MEKLNSRPVPKPRNYPSTSSNITKSEYENVELNIVDNENNKLNLDEIDNSISKENIKIELISNISEENKRPVPAPRKKVVDIVNESSDQQYVNVNIKPKENQKININSGVRKAPDIPNRLKNNTNKEVNVMPKSNNLLKSNDFVFDDNDTLDNNKHERKSFSGSIFSNSSSSLHSSNENISKYKNKSPSDLLKTIGATSRMLGDSITERVVGKTKDAKHKIDKNLKISKEKIEVWGTETTKSASTKLKNVRKKITSMGGINKDKKFNNLDDHDNNRPQTLPPNDAILNSISFNSPLNNKVNNFEDLSVVESSYEIPTSSRRFYIPSPPTNTSSRSSNNCNNSYDEVASVHSKQSNLSLSDSSSSMSLGSVNLSFERNTPMTQSMYSSVGTRPKLSPPTEGNLHRNKSDSNINKLISTPLIEELSSSSSSENLPCPKIPAPVLNTEQIYGKIKKLNTNVESPNIPERPARNRRKTLEAVELRKQNLSSNRATVDSKEIKEKEKDFPNQYPRIFSRHVNFTSPSISSGKILKENNTDSSESWSFYDGARISERNDDSSPEPVYENNDVFDSNLMSESVYAKLCDMDSENDKFLLKPSKVSETSSNNVSKPVAPNLFKHDDDIDTRSNLFKNINNHSSLLTEILSEFDPLLASTSNINDKTKSNKLDLLGHFLEEDTYGCREERNINYRSDQDSQSLNISSIESDEDNTNEEDDILDIESEVPTPPIRIDSLNINLNEPSSPSNSTDMVIIHQNMNLRADSVENILTELPTNVQENVLESKIEDNSGSRTNWFISESENNYVKKNPIPSVNRNDRKNIDKVVKSIPKLKLNDDREAPPPYSEAIACGSKKHFIKNKDEKETIDSNQAQHSSASSSNIKTSSSMKNMFNSVMEGLNKNLKKKSNPKSETRTIIEMIPRPILSQRYIHNEGHLIKFPSGVVEDILKELSPRHCVLRERCFSAYLDANHKQLKEQILIENVTTVQCVNNNQKLSNNTPDMHCFEITIAKNVQNQLLSNPNLIISSNNSGNRKINRTTQVYGIAKRTERNIWIQKLIESMTSVFPTKYTCEYTRGGWCYLKNSISSQWSGTWLLLSGRKLLYYTQSDMNLEILDLRKARCIGLKDYDDSILNLHVEKGPILTIDCPPYSIYTIMNCPRETKIWKHIIKETAHNNGRSLKHQQLTKDNIPVIVDKCINFIYTNGSMSEGIYRKSGSEGNIQKLLAAFSTDAFDVQITRTEYTEHDIANVLKRFMRDLPEKLLEKYAVSFISVAAMTSIREKIQAYKELLARLSVIEYQTLKKLIGHLNFIQSQKHRNKMDVANLAMIWGITLLRKHNPEDDTTYSDSESKVLNDLIVLYKNLYQLTADEVAKEQIMLSVLQKYHAAAENLSDSVKQSGDLKVWITIDPNPEIKNEEKRQVNVSLTPTKTVYDICKELSHHMGEPIHNLTLNEIILEGELERPMHYTEKALDTVLRWTSWSDMDRKNNFLKLTKTNFLDLVHHSIRNVGTIIPNSELKFADYKTKNVKPYTLELIDNKIIIMRKEKNTIIKIREINLCDIIAYIGYEKKRGDLNTLWAITLIDRNFQKRTRDSPYIGHILAGTTSQDKVVWYSHIMYNSYKTNILPNPEMIIP